MARLPAIYLPHGGGPWPFVELNFGTQAEWAPLREYLENLYLNVTAQYEKPRAILCITAHWEAALPTVSSNTRPPMLYDYGGFPAESYKIEWNAPGDPHLASRVRELLDDAKIASGDDPNRGFDHGTFVPLKLADPAANYPTVQLSLVRGLDPDAHLRIGAAISALRDEGVLIIGSGSSFHNMRAFGTREALPASKEFDTWLAEILALPEVERTKHLIHWSEGPKARFSHPREEHLLPLQVVAGTAGPNESVTFPFRGVVLGTQMLAAQFG
jgi:aromatic ring-opening dioxygenase catalytic subunit (LigB family)